MPYDAICSKIVQGHGLKLLTFYRSSVGMCDFCITPVVYNCFCAIFDIFCRNLWGVVLIDTFDILLEEFYMLQPEDDGPRPLSWEEVNVGRCCSMLVLVVLEMF